MERKVHRNVENQRDAKSLLTAKIDASAQVRDLSGNGLMIRRSLVRV